MTQRTLNLVNNSGRPGSMVVFQGASGSVSALAWLARYAYPGTTIGFQWDDTSWCFAWAGTGQLGPGVVVQASQTVPADPAGQNQIVLSYYAQQQTFNLHDPSAGSPQGSFVIRQDTSIPSGGASVGIGMAGKPTLMVQAMPNMMVTILAQTRYWLAFGDYQQGQCLDAATQQATELVFPPNVTSMTATLNPDGSWAIQADILAREPDATA